MVAQSTARRPRRAQKVESDDALLTKAIEITEWVRRNSGVVIGVAVALIVAAGAFLWYRADQNRRLDEASIAFLQVEQSTFVGDDAMATRDLQEFIQRHDGTPYADEARVLLAQVHLRENRAQEAITILQAVPSNPDSPVGPQAGLLLATAQASAGDRQAAIASYLRVADSAESPFRQQEGLIGAALLRSEAGDHAGAAELYRRLVALQEAGSQDQALFEMRLAEEEALATAQ